MGLPFPRGCWLKPRSGISRLISMKLGAWRTQSREGCSVDLISIEAEALAFRKLEESRA